MDKQLTQTEADAIEAIMDRVGLSTFSAACACICEGKGQHLRANWQDTNHARNWENMGVKFTQLEYAARRVLS